MALQESFVQMKPKWAAALSLMAWPSLSVPSAGGQADGGATALVQSKGGCRVVSLQPTAVLS